MAELTPEMQAAGIFLDANGIPTLPDGTPALRQNQAPSDIPRGDTSAPLLAEIARQAAAANIGGSSDGRGEGPEGQEPPQDLQTVGGFPYPQDPVGYGFAPYYNENPLDYQDSKRGPPLAPPLWNMGMEGPPPEGAFIQDKPGDWMRFYTPNDQSTGGGFFFAKDAFPNGVPMAFQQGATRPSTNNWRLFGGHPRQVMRNGYIINLDATDLRGPGYVALEGGSSRGANWQWDPTAGFPANYSYTQGLSFFGWPGNSQWASGGIGGDTS